MLMLCVVNTSHPLDRYIGFLTSDIQFTMSEQHLLWRTDFDSTHIRLTLSLLVSHTRNEIDSHRIHIFRKNTERDIGANIIYILRMMESIMLLTDVFDVMQCVSDKGFCNISHPYFRNFTATYTHIVHISICVAIVRSHTCTTNWMSQKAIV